MNRRQILKQLAVGTTAAILLPSCISDPRKVSIALNDLDIDGEEESLLAEIAEVLIPETNTPGARTMNAHHFTLIMVDDCQTDEIKAKYLKGLRAFEAACEQIGGKTFTESDPTERITLLKQIEKGNEDLSDEVRTFYRLTRRYIVQGYTSSSYFLTEVKPYELIPGPDFKGCVPVNETSKVV